MSEKWEMVPPSEALDAIAQWRELDLVSEEKDTVLEKFEQIFGAALPFFRSGYSLPGASVFYRIRRWEYEINHVDQLWAKRFDVNMGRCNFEGEPMLYISTDTIPTGCFDELNVEPGEQVYLITYVRKQGQPLFVRPPFGEDLHKHEMADGVLKSDEDRLSYRILREFLISEFMKPTCSKCDGSNFLYNVTASICSYMKGAPRVDGFSYPSAVNIHSTNVALFPEAEQKLEIKSVEVLKLIKRSETGSITCHRKSIAEFDGDKVSWLSQARERWFRRWDGQ